MGEQQVWSPRRWRSIALRDEWLWLVALFLMGASELEARSVLTPESMLARRVCALLEADEPKMGGEPLTSWDQFEEINRRLAGFGMEDVASHYVFVDLDQRAAYLEGELVLVAKRALRYPNGWRERLLFLNTPNPDDTRYKPIRFVIYRDASDRWRTQRWDEMEFREMLRNTGINLPNTVSMDWPENTAAFVDWLLWWIYRWSLPILGIYLVYKGLAKWYRYWITW